MARTALLLLLTVGLATTLPAAPVATLGALEGEVTLLRSGVLIPSERVAEGLPLEAFDTISTGSTGRADVRFSGSVGLAGSVRLEASTVLYLDVTSLKKEQTFGIELLTGTVNGKVSATSGPSSLEVRTDAGVFSTALGSFRVVGSSVGDYLVTVASGRVTCQLADRTVFVEPGSVVQVLALEHSAQTLPMNVSTLDAFEGTWLQQREQSARNQSAVVFRSLASRYQLQVGLFQRAWERVQREAKDDDKALRAATANLRRAAFPLERSLYRVRDLRALLDAGVLSPSLELSRGYAARDFFRQAATDEALWFGRLGDARARYKALADRSGGTFPRALDAGGITGDSDFFH